MPKVRSLAPVLSLVSLVAFGAFLFASAWLARLERGGPPHADLTLEGEVPATLFLPRPSSGEPFSAFVNAPPPAERPPVVVLTHGISSDRTNVSSLARKLAGAGFAVLTLDHRGHGADFRRYSVRCLCRNGDQRGGSGTTRQDCDGPQ